MKILITGVAGFMGSHLADDLLSRGHTVVGIDNLSGGSLSNVPDGVEFLQEDLANLGSIRPIFDGVDVVIHTACTAYEGVSVFSPAFITQNTYQITATTLSAAIDAGVKKFVFMSSMARYGNQPTTPFTEDMTPNPVDPYGIAKVASEDLIKNLCEVHGIDWSIVVPHNIIGPRQKYDDPYRNVAAIMINKMLKGEQPIIYGDGMQKRQFSFMSDVVEPMRTIVETKLGNSQVINVGPDSQTISIKTLALIISELVGFKDLKPIYLDDRPQEIKVATCSANKAREYLNYNPKIDLVDGLAEMVEYIKSNGTKDFDYRLDLEISSHLLPKSWTEKLI
jgi:UDP-glucose 4-epimerase